MLKDCLEIFEREYKSTGNSLITDSYVLSYGTYILVKDFSKIEKLEISKNDVDNTTQIYSKFCELDYLSKLVSIDKSIDSKKLIHSNNYLSFFVKKENLKPNKNNNVKLTEDIIDNYYDALLNPRIKYKSDKRKKEIYDLMEKEYGKVDEKKLNKIRTWIKDNIFTLVENNKKDKNYLKIFFDEKIDLYNRENQKYLHPNIYNKNYFNIIIDGKTYGLPNDNMQLSEKKPFSELKTRKNSTPYLVSEDEVFLQKAFFDYLMNKAANGEEVIYISSEKGIHRKTDIPNEFSGYILRIKKGKELEIHDFDTVVNLNTKIKKINVKFVIPIEYDKYGLNPSLEVGYINNLKKLEKTIDTIYFNTFMCNSYFREVKEINLNDLILRDILVRNRDGLYTWFYKGRDNIVRQTFSNYSMEIIKNSIKNNNYVKAKEQYNLRIAIINYFYGGYKMADKIKYISESLFEKINSKQTQCIQSDEEYYFAIGQLASYLISKNKSSKNKNHSLINPILNARNKEKLMLEIRKLFKKYNYAIDYGSKRFDNLYAMIVGYEVEDKKINGDLLIGGYLYSNLIYTKREEKEDE
ncbi:CRISPR-associated protein Cse4 [Clostridioides sp. ES-S-0145-01]|uniref:CRISPR-associated protein Cse4 n=1 Tax=Clostridioides sp. ES-S-0145-01 TaxID=2770784 RepID=UPI001D11EDBC